MTGLDAFVLVVVFGWGMLAGLRVKHRRFLAERQRRRECKARLDGYDRNAFATDLAEVGPVTPPRPEVDLYDQDSDQEIDPYPYPGRPEGLARRGISEAVMVNGGCVRCARDHEGFILRGGAWFALCDEHYAEVVEISMEGV